MSKFVFEFEEDFETGTLEPEPIGNLYLGRVHRVRIMLLEDGVHLWIPEAARDKVHFWSVPSVGITGLGLAPEGMSDG